VRFCDSPLLAQYDIAGLAQDITRADMAHRPSGLWRWSELLPVRDPSFQCTLGEGDTPLLKADRLGNELGMENLYIKEEGRNPTGTFKARGMAVAVSRAVELGVGEVVSPTAGNAGGALASYAARAGLKAHVFMPLDVPIANREEVVVAGADLRSVDGLIDEAGRQATALARDQGWLCVATFKEPYRVEGKKTMGFEIAEAFGWGLPEVIVYPTGGGTGLVGMWKAFDELEALGWVDERRPRMISVQADGCAPIVGAIDRGDTRVQRWEDPSTIAHGLRVPGVYADRLVLRVIRESGGTAIAVTDDEICEAQSQIAHFEGVFACPEGAATLAALRRLLQQDGVSPDERVVLFNTGSGLKYLQ
jgi:threonine synthase